MNGAGYKSKFQEHDFHFSHTRMKLEKQYLIGLHLHPGWLKR